MINRKNLLTQLQQQPDCWITIQATSVTENKAIKETMKYKSMHVKSRYWNAQENIDARVVIDEPTANQTYPRVKIQMRYVSKIKELTPLEQAHPITISPNPEITKLIANIEALLKEGDDLTRLAKQILETLNEASPTALSDIESRIHTARAIKALNLEPVFEREDYYK